MKKLLLVAFFTTMLAGCVVAPGPGGYDVDLAPPLPAVIELGPDPYYVYGGYYYYYHNNRWDYSRTSRGPWTELPRSHWPREVRHGGMGDHREREFRHEHEER